MLRGMDRISINLAVALLVFVGVSASISPWLDGLYSRITIWALIIGSVIWGLKFLIKDVADALALDHEIHLAERENGATVRDLAKKHAAHPEVARELAAQMLEEKRRQQEGAAPPVAPPSGA